MAGKFDGRTAIVSGAAQGIGAAYARHLASLGATVVVADIDKDGAEATAAAIASGGASAWSAHVDISDEQSTADLARAVIDRDGRIDILVNNAAIYAGLSMDAAEDIDVAYWRRMVDVNITGTYLMCRAVIPQMRRQRSGKIVNQSSIAAFVGAPLVLHYSVTKAAAVTMTQCLARELGEDNINVNAIAPGLIDTPATQGVLSDSMQEMYILQMAIKRVGTTEDLLGALEFLCGPESDYVTGQTLVVDGGIVTVR
jgi:3-oxoacyl-[acyl-carrier protein] reductase